MDHIKNTDQLEFIFFCIDNVAAAVNRSTVEIYDALKTTGFLYDYIVDNYGALHTQGKEYIVNDILSAAERKGITL